MFRVMKAVLALVGIDRRCCRGAGAERAEARDCPDLRRPLPVPEQLSLFGVSGDARGRHRHRSDQRRGPPRWLKSEIASRFGKQIRYLVYSHDHADHISGGEVFATDGAIVIAQENAKRTILGERRPTAVPHITFKKRMTLELGGKTVELRYLGKNHSDNMIVMHFPDERTLFAVDFIPVKTVAFRDFPDAYLPEWIESLARVERMDFDILAPGHGPLGHQGRCHCVPGIHDRSHRSGARAGAHGKVSR